MKLPGEGDDQCQRRFFKLKLSFFVCALRKFRGELVLRFLCENPTTLAKITVSALLTALAKVVISLLRLVKEVSLGFVSSSFHDISQVVAYPEHPHSEAVLQDQVDHVAGLT